MSLEKREKDRVIVNEANTGSETSPALCRKADDVGRFDFPALALLSLSFPKAVVYGHRLVALPPHN